MKFHLNLGGVKQSLKKYLSQAMFLGLLFQGIPGDVLAQSNMGSPPLLPYSLEQSTISFATDQTQPLSVALVNPIEVRLTESLVDKETRLAREALAASLRVRTSSRVLRTTPEPDFPAKRVLVQRAAAAYGIPWEVLEAVWQIESGKSWDTHVRSYAGAQGPAQFMPATWRRYGVDGDGDGVANIHSAVDAVYGAANYLAANGANRGDIHRALFAYNHAEWYVQKVLRVADEIGYQG
ncbi:MAG: lytic transglycosylase domain-containing protein [Patescibacteria group bacterium]